MQDDIENIPMAQGPAVPASAEDLAHDEAGVTYPNLHRRINTDLARLKTNFNLATPEGENLAAVGGSILTVQAEYGPGGAQTFQLNVQCVNSYRTTTPLVHDEDSTTSEVP